MKKTNTTHSNVFAFGKLALLAAAFSLVGVSGLHADDVVKGVQEFKDGKELDGEERLRIPREGDQYNPTARLRFIGDKTTVTRAIEPQNNGRRGHGDGVIEVVKPDAVLTLTSLHGNNESGVYRRTHKRGLGTLVLAGDEDNDGAKLVVWEGTVILAKDSDSGTHAQGSGFLEIYSTSTENVGKGRPNVSGVVVLGGKGGDQIADEAPLVIGGVHSDRGGILDLNTRTETVGGLGLTNGTLRFAFGGAPGKTGTLTVESESPIGATGKNTIDITDGASWAAGDYNLIKASEEIGEDVVATFTLKGLKNGKLSLGKDKKTLVLTVTK
ncbi:MAG: hypothetical protein LBV28_01890 [Puniceicoccales bacterium]|jgi:hypothetical protein|nr:hypothetical protein [Puniceicoccales bacterium]